MRTSPATDNNVDNAHGAAAQEPREREAPTTTQRVERISIIPRIQSMHSTFEVPQVGTLGYYADTEAGGVPMVLLHSVNVGASSHDVLPLFEELRAARVCYALDLPGFGTSTRVMRRFDVNKVRDGIRSFLHRVASTHRSQVDVVALSLSSEFAAQIALEDRSPIRSLTLISPTGLSARGEGLWPEVFARAAENVLMAPIIGGLAYSALTSKLNIRRRLTKNFTGPIDAELVDHVFTASQEPSARFAHASILGRRLHTKSAWSSLYARVHVPTLIIFDQDPTTDFEYLPQLTKKNPEVRARRIAPTHGMPHYERTAEVVKIIEAFYEDRSLSSHPADLTH